MKKSMFAIGVGLLVTVVLVLTGCGGGGGSNGSSGSGGGGSKYGDAVKLISSEKLTNGSYRYKLGLNSAKIPGDRDSPFVKGNFNGWQAQTITDSDKDDYYEIEFITYDGFTSLSYGGNFTKNSWAVVSDSVYYDSANDNLKVGCYQGQIYTNATMPEVIAPDAVKLISSEKLANGNYRYNLGLSSRNIGGDKSAPFAMGNFNGWQAQSITDSDGDGYYELTLDNAGDGYVSISYGGNFAAGSYANGSGSAFYNPTTDNLRFCLNQGGISTADQMPKLGAIKLITKEKQTDGTYKYTLGLNAADITGDKTSPFVISNLNGWQAQAVTDSDGDGYYEYTVTTGNTIVNLSYGGNRTAGSWADVNGTSFYDRLNNNLRFGLSEGNLIPPESVPVDLLSQLRFVRGTRMPDGSYIYTIGVEASFINGDKGHVLVSGDVTGLTQLAAAADGEAGYFYLNFTAKNGIINISSTRLALFNGSVYTPDTLTVTSPKFVSGGTVSGELYRYRIGIRGTFASQNNFTGWQVMPFGGGDSFHNIDLVVANGVITSDTSQVGFKDGYVYFK